MPRIPTYRTVILSDGEWDGVCDPLDEGDVKPHRMKRLGKKAAKRAQKAARSLPAHMQDIAFSYADNRTRESGTFGPASEVRTVDPATVDVSRYMKGKN